MAWLDIVKVRFVFFLRQPLQISESFSVFYLHKGFTLDCRLILTLTCGHLKVTPVNNTTTAPVTNPEKVLLLSFAVFTVAVGAEE